MAAATHHEHLASLLQDMLTAERGIRTGERVVVEGEVGKKPKELPGMVVIGIQRDEKLLDVGDLDAVKLKSKDIIIFLEKKP